MIFLYILYFCDFFERKIIENNIYIDKCKFHYFINPSSQGSVFYSSGTFSSILKNSEFKNCISSRSGVFFFSIKNINLSFNIIYNSSTITSYCGAFEIHTSESSNIFYQSILNTESVLPRIIWFESFQSNLYCYNSSFTKSQADDIYITSSNSIMTIKYILINSSVSTPYGGVLYYSGGTFQNYFITIINSIFSSQEALLLIRVTSIVYINNLFVWNCSNANYIAYYQGTGFISISNSIIEKPQYLNIINTNSIFNSGTSYLFFCISENTTPKLVKINKIILNYILIINI